jgi:phosphoribosylformylglycinamidine cyclo-ligase
MKYVKDGVRIIKDNLFEAPAIFPLLQAASSADNREMSQVFNMGQRLEIYTDPSQASTLIDLGSKYGIEAQIIGRVEESSKKELIIERNGETLIY